MRTKAGQQSIPERNPGALALRSKGPNLSEVPGTDLAAGPGHTMA